MKVPRPRPSPSSVDNTDLSHLQRLRAPRLSASRSANESDPEPVLELEPELVSEPELGPFRLADAPSGKASAVDVLSDSGVDPS